MSLEWSISRPLYVDSIRCFVRNGEYHTCPDCPGIGAIICDRELLPEDDPQNNTQWLQWTKITTTRPDGQTKDRWDFVSTETSVQVPLREMKSAWNSFMEHHFDAKWAPCSTIG